MNERQARKQGLSFTGKYTSHLMEKNRLLQEAKEIRKRGYRAVIVDCPSSKYSRGGSSMGWSVYAHAKYFEDIYKVETLETLKNEKKYLSAKIVEMGNRLAEVVKELETMEVK